jgi:hypothetical protein
MPGFHDIVKEAWQRKVP